MVSGRNIDRDTGSCRRPPRGIEDSFETAKNEFGLDHNETRSWDGWHRHVSFVMLAFAMMAAIRQRVNQLTPKKSQMQQQNAEPHPLVDPGNPPDCTASQAAAYPARLRHRMVTVASCPSGRRTESSLQTESTTVMLGRALPPM
jgi:hypothetical protein